jgi:DNA-binding NarL/FixJ family response regulator
MKLGKGGDLADFCMLHQDNALPALTALPDLEVDQPQVAGFYPWEIIHANDLHSLPKVEWVIPGEIQALGLNVVFGASGVGKSFYALDKALVISQDQTVVYMAGEGIYGYNKRISAWEKFHKKQRGKLYMCTGAVSLLDKEEFAAFLHSIKYLKPSVVVVDTLARSMTGGDENNARDMGLFIRACDDIKHTLGCAVILVHHTGKDKHSERGSSALRGAADVMIKISDEGDILIVEMDKVKDDETLPLRYFKLLPIDLDQDQGSSVVFIPAEKYLQTSSDRLSPNQQKIMRLLADVFTDGATAKEISEETRIAHSSVKRDLGHMKTFGFVSQEDRGLPYLITEAGQAALKRTLHIPDGSMDQQDQWDQQTHNPVAFDSTDPIDPSDPLIQPSMFGERVHSHYEEGM